MDVWDAPVRDVRPLLTSGRAELVVRLGSLSATQWAAPTEAGHWTVGAVARHLLDDDLGLLSRWRDGDRSGLIPVDGPHAAFVAALDAKNERWVTAAAGLSSRVVADLLAWSGSEVDAFLATVDLRALRHVSWAGGEVPAWLDVAREHTERWVHGRHIADAVGAASPSGIEEVLRGRPPRRPQHHRLILLATLIHPGGGSGSQEAHRQGCGGPPRLPSRSRRPCRPRAPVVQRPRTPAFQAGNAGSNPVGGAQRLRAGPRGLPPRPGPRARAAARRSTWSPRPRSSRRGPATTTPT
jgi:hypothetical protein